MRTRTMVLGLGLAVLVVSGAFAGDEILGRDVARGGIVTEVAGRLFFDSSEWFLDADTGMYELHMGPLGHDESLALTDGESATVRGFLLGEHLAPITLDSAGLTHGVWLEDRFPSWAGNGARRNELTEDERDERGSGQFAAAPIDEASEAREGFGRVGVEPARRNQVLRPGRGR